MRRICSYSAPTLALTAGLLLLLSGPAEAQAVGDALEDMIVTMKGQLDAVGTRLGDLVRQAMITLLVVDFTLRAGRAILGDSDVTGLVKGFAFQLGFVSCVWLLAGMVPVFVHWLARTALDIAGTAGGANIEPGAMVGQGLSRAWGWMQAMELWSPGTWFYIFAAVISIIVLAMSVAMLVVIWAELYLVGLAGIAALLFAGLTETRDIALGYVNALIGKAFKLMGLMIVISSMGAMTDALATSAGAGLLNAMGIVLLQIVSGVMILTLPQTIEALVAGAKIGSRSAEMVGRMAGSAGKTMAVTGAGTAVGAAVGTVAGAKAGAGASGIGKAALTGARNTGMDWGSAAARGDIRGSIARKISEKIGRTGGEDT